MLNATDDVRIDNLRPLLPPAILMEELPLAEQCAELVASTRKKVGDIVSGRDDRLVVIVGPCSVHDPKAAVEYASRLKKKNSRNSVIRARDCHACLLRKASNDRWLEGLDQRPAARWKL